MKLESHDALSLLRPLLGVLVLGELLRAPASWLVLPAIVLACASDFYDGRLARRAGHDTQAGLFVDNICDAVFLAAALAGFAFRQVWSDPATGSATRYWIHANWLPLAALAASFGPYLLRLAYCTRRGLAPGRSPRGHTAGVANYALVLLGGLAVLPGFTMTPWLTEPSFATVVLLNLSAAGENMTLLATALAEARSKR